MLRPPPWARLSGTALPGAVRPGPPGRGAFPLPITIVHILPVAVLLAAGPLKGPSATSAEAPTPVAAPAPAPLLTRGDGWFAAASVAGVAAAALGDGWAWRQAQAPEAGGTQSAARLAEHFGNPIVVGPALLASYATGRIANLPQLSSGSARVAGAILGAGALCEGLKLAVGRVRPRFAPNDPDEFRPFHVGDPSFPSGHSTVAFAAAAAIDAETEARWVPWVVYPAATAVAWSRVREDWHWTSDVVAGAALGWWAGRKVDAIERGRVRLFDRARFLFHGNRRNFRVGFQAKF